MKSILAIVFISFAVSLHAEDSLTRIGFLHQDAYIETEITSLPQSCERSVLEGRLFLRKQNTDKALTAFLNSLFTDTPFTETHLAEDSILAFVSAKKKRSLFFYSSLFEIMNIYYKKRRDNFVLQLFPLFSPEDTFNYRNAALLAANAYIYTGKKDQAETLLRNLVEKENPNDTALLPMLRLAQLNKKQGKYAEAAHLYQKIIIRNDDWLGKFAVEGLVALLKKKTDLLSRKEIAEIADKIASLSPSHLRSLSYSVEVPELSLASAYARLGNFDAVESLAQRFPASKDAIYLAAADIAYKNQKFLSAATLYEQSGSLSDIASFRLHESAYRAGKINFSAFIKTIDSHKILYAPHLWIAAREKIVSGMYFDAVKLLEQLLNDYPEADEAPGALFWLWKLSSENRNEHLSLLILKYPDSYYAARAAVIIDASAMQAAIDYQNSLNKDLVKRYFAFFRNSRPFPPVSIQHFEILSDKKIESIFLPYVLSGDRSAFTAAFNYYTGRSQNFLPLYSTMVQLGFSYEIPYLPVRYFSFTQERLEPLNPSRFDGTTTAMLFPRPFISDVTKTSSRFSVTASFIYALMKTESAFDPSVISPSGARGLMQLMPPTAREEAARLKMKNYNLHEPSDSIKLGTGYLSFIIKNNGNDFFTAAAAYNAGITNARKWAATLPTDKNFDDLFIEKIDFPETARYVKNVMYAYYCYEALY